MIYIDNLPITNFKDVEIVEEVSGSLTLSFTSFNFENKAHHLLKEEEIVNVDGYDFVIKQINESTYTKQVAAVSTFFKLGGKYTHEIYGGTRTIRQFLDFIFKDTGWTYSYTGNNPYIFIPNFGEDNKLKLIQDFIAVAKIEYKIEPKNHVVFKKEIGTDNNAQYRYGHNISALNKSVDTTDLVTRVKGIGANGLKVTYTSPYADSFGIIEAEPIVNDEVDDPDILLEHIKNNIQDVPLLAIELDAIELRDRELGEKVWLIYEPLKVDMQSRILQITKTIRNGQLFTKSVVLGNHKPKTQTDLLAKQQVEIDKQNKINRSRFEQTNDRITMEVEEINGDLEEQKALLEITAKEIKSEVSHLDKTLSDRITKANSRITQTASEIRSEVEKEVKYLDGRVDSANSKISQTAREIRSEINTTKSYLDGRIDKANSSITQTASQIRSEVNSTKNELDGRITKAESSITQTAESIRIDVAKEVKEMNDRVTKSEVNVGILSDEIRSEVKQELSNYDDRFEGITNAVSKVEQKADRITTHVNSVETTVDGLERKVTNYSSQINQLDREISMKVSADDIASEINQTSQRVKIRASKIDMDGIVRLSASVELGTTTPSATKAIKFNSTDAWIYSTGANLNISSEYLFIDSWTSALSPISHRQGGLVLAPDDGLWIGIQSDGSLRVSNGSQVRYYAPI